MPGTTLPDPSVIIDMWVTHDAKSLIDAGHQVINSSDGVTYLVPGAHYYGVNNSGIYQNWEPYKISGDPAMNPDKNDPHLLGGKLHIWGDQGPSGYTLTEIADLALPSVQVFSEKLWGRKASPSYKEFIKRPAISVPIPGTTIFARSGDRTRRTGLSIERREDARKRQCPDRVAMGRQIPWRTWSIQAVGHARRGRIWNIPGRCR